jgi:hypothetical protein
LDHGVWCRYSRRQNPAVLRLKKRHFIGRSHDLKNFANDSVAKNNIAKALLIFSTPAEKGKK